MKDISLYIHIPFCKNAKCLYCDFVSFCGKNDQIDSYVQSLCEEMHLRSHDLQDYSIKTIYIGGGTPSVLSVSQITKIFDALKSNFNLSNLIEFTIEVNPESVTKEKLLAYKSFGVNRISMGAQSMNDEVLSTIGRQHKAKEFVVALDISQELFDNVSVDMMLGLPNQTLQDVISMAEFLCSQKVQHISAYSLMIEENTPLFSLVQHKKISIPEEDATIEMYDKVSKILQKNGLKRYEVSNFARKGKESLHNLNYWQCGEYLGLGVAAHSHISNKRFSNTQSLEKYIDMLSCLKLPIDSEELLSPKDRREEYVMLSLRTSQGIDLKKYLDEFGQDILVEKANEISTLQKQNLINITPTNLSLTNKGFHILNSIVLQLI